MYVRMPGKTWHLFKKSFLENRPMIHALLTTRARIVFVRNVVAETCAHRSSDEKQLLASARALWRITCSLAHARVLAEIFEYYSATTVFELDKDHLSFAKTLIGMRHLVWLRSPVGQTACDLSLLARHASCTSTRQIPCRTSKPHQVPHGYKCLCEA